MKNLTAQFEIPRTVVPAFSVPILGAKTTLTPRGEKLVLASYFEPSFEIYGIQTGVERTPDIILESVISNEVSADYDGGTPTTLWSAPAPGHTAPRAGSAQISMDGRVLFYAQNGGMEIGRLNLGDKVKTVQPPLRGLQERNEDFLFLSDGRIATIENYKECKVRIYEQEEDELRLDEEFPLRATMLYGLCELDGQLLLLANSLSKIEGGAGVYALNIAGEKKGELAKDERFVGLPLTARGLAPVHFNQTLQGLLVTTYDFRRDTESLGAPSSLSYVRALER